MTARTNCDNYRALFLNNTPLMDTRAPVEYARGAFPNVVNMPLMNDEERHQVGIRYKEQGQDAAIALGNELVSGAEKARRIRQWCQFARDHSDGYLYCFRGGLRSQTVQRWMAEAGVSYPLIPGGYKAMRRFLIDELPLSIAASELVLIAGKTGTGKTRVIEQLSRAVDLEGLAHHRGSSFGQLLDEQPMQQDFENALGIALLRLAADEGGKIYLEDEGRLIGRVYLPDALREAMDKAPLLVVEESMHSRVAVVVDDYVVDLGERYVRRYADRGPGLHREKLLADLGRIRKRLGGADHEVVESLMQAAFDAQEAGRGVAEHGRWVEYLLQDYYDPMYDYQMSKRQGRVNLRGSREEILQAARRNQ